MRMSSDPYNSPDEVDALSRNLTPLPLKMRLCVMMFLQYFVQGCYLPIASLYLQRHLGFSADQVGMFGSAIALGPLFAPVIVGQLVDRLLATQIVLAFCHLAAGVLMIVLFLQTQFVAILLLGIGYSVLYVPSMMLTNSLAFHHLQNREREFPLIRLWGTIGFIVPAWLIEPILTSQFKGSELEQARGFAFLLAGIAGVGMAIYSFTLPRTPPQPRRDRPFAPLAIAEMLRLRHFAVLVTITFLIAIVHKFYFVWNSPFLNDLLKVGQIEGAWEQRISSIGQISEIAVMAVLGFSVSWLGFKATMLIGTLAYLLRCLILFVPLSFEMPFGLALTLACLGQAMHGFCFGCFLAAAYMFVDRVAHSDLRGSMQNLYGTFVVGAGFVVGGIVAGRIGKWFTSVPGEETLREKLGITLTAGLTRFTQREGDVQVELIRDWPGIWLSCAMIAVVCVVGFFLFFPSGAEDETVANKANALPGAQESGHENH